MFFPRILRAALTACAVTAACATPCIARADSSDEAGRHFEAGVRAFDEQRFGDAAEEFERAYDLKPNWQVLYNLGSVYAALGKPVESADALERYLDQSVGNIGDARKSEVEAELARQRAKIGQIEITISERGAAVRVDTTEVGQSPLTLPVRVSAGPHVVDVLLEGKRPERREVVVNSQEFARLKVTLVPLVAPVHAAPKAAPHPPAVPPPVAEESRTPGSGQRIAAYIVGGLGLAGVGVGIGLGAKGQSDHLDAVDLAKAGHRNQAESLESDADHEKTLAYATAGIGGAMVLGGVILLLTAPSNVVTHASSHVSPWASASSSGLSIYGTF